MAKEKKYARAGKFFKAASGKSEKSQEQFSPGKMGRSQVVSTFGIGSIYELRAFSRKSGATLNSVMIAGLDWWKSGELETIREPALENALGVKYFKLPPTDAGSGPSVFLPALRFPRWLVCNRCHRLGVVPSHFEDIGKTGPKCRAAGCGGKGIPARLIVACYGEDGDGSQPGHIDDFPWVWWAHSEHGSPCEKPQLKLETTGQVAGLSGLVVRCYSSSCKGQVGRSLGGVFGRNALSKLKCWGNRPWLNDNEKDCHRRIRAVLRGASNVYFAVMASAISIPPNSDRLVQLIANRCDALVQSVGKLDLSMLVQLVKNALPEMRDEFSDAQIEGTLLLLAGQEDTSSPTTEDQQRERERRAIVEGRVEEDGGEFVARPVPVGSSTQSISVKLDRLVKVHRLREVRALRGFQRITPSAGGDSYRSICAPIARQRKNWLPAIEVRGEGIYFELNIEKIREWEESDPVRNRQGILQRNYQTMCNAAGRSYNSDEAPSARLVLLHTLSHLIMKQLSLECGYSSASLRERLYVHNDHLGNDWAGALIYTATTGADGTLGGLVRQGDAERFEKILMGAIEGAYWCSSDPLCIESGGQGADALNLAACHACCLVSETSCELRNMFLDRGFLIGLPGMQELGFWYGLQSII